ncbi:MAG: dihydrolipoyl dehydrogenase [Parachlamydiaceae bacterium]|nr:dihydrolipoyl dehydrogenase [Parachlamydiaceae bacterium]
MTDRYDVAIIGAGPGGYVAAIRAAQLGLKTVCIDKRNELGGTCLNVGCIPSKTLLHSTELYSRLQNEGAEHGITVKDLSINFDQLMKRKKAVVKSLVDGVGGLFKQHQITTVNGEASFIDPKILEIKQSDGKSFRIEANSIIIATGSAPIPLLGLPFDERQVVSSTGVLSLSKIPQRMVVVGGGVIGVELASVYQRLGTDVTIIEMLDHICPAMDKKVSATLLQILKKQGIKFMLSCKVVTAVVQPNEVILTVNENDKLQNIGADIVLVAVGRKPYSEGLNLDKIGIKADSKGFIPVDSCYRTSQPNIFAIGDVIEGTMLAHRAFEEGVAVAEHIAGKRAIVNYLAVPNVIYTYPEVASVGLTEEEAKVAGIELMIGICSFRGNPRARCSFEMEGFVKVIGEVKSGRLIGMHIIGAHASELIEEGMMAMDKKATLHDIAYAAHAHPTLSEAIKEAALIALGQPIHT